MSSKSQEIDNRAAEWAVRRDVRDLTPEETAELEAWLAADIRHYGAYCKAQAIMARLGRMHGISFLRSRVHEELEKPQWSRRRILTGSVAASVAAAGLIGAVLGKHPVVETFATQIGQTREALLSDGSAITLNTNSEVSVEFTGAARKVHLVRGEALFDVAKDKHRPFFVVAGDTEVRAIGTSFTVSMLPDRPVQVVVKEGVVELNRANAVMSMPVRVSANIRALAPRNAAIMTAVIPEAKLERDLAWQQGRIAFENQTLQHAAEEFARYSEVRIVVDSSAAHRTVTGLFASNDPIGFAKTTAALLDLRIDVSDRQVKLFDDSEKTR